MMLLMSETDPFAGLGKALARLRERAGFSTQTEAAKALTMDKGQLSRWENERPRPTLGNLGQVLRGYGATVGDLAGALGAVAPQPKAAVRGPSDEVIESLWEAVRRVEEWQIETEGRIERLERAMRERSGRGPNVS